MSVYHPSAGTVTRDKNRLHCRRQDSVGYATDMMLGEAEELMVCPSAKCYRENLEQTPESKARIGPRHSY